jgi:uridine kinase
VEITSHVLSRYQAAASRGQPRVAVGVCGRAGAGKTTFAGNLADELRSVGVPCAVYSGDWRFSLNSSRRRSWLRESWKEGLNSYLRAIHQYNWWEFKRIYDDVHDLLGGRAVELRAAYNRLSGHHDLRIRIPALSRGIVLLENAILGGADCLGSLETIVLLQTPDRICFDRTLQKDMERRTLPEIASRFLVTTQSENVFFEMVMRCFPEKLLVCDDLGTRRAVPELSAVPELPVPRDLIARIQPHLSAEVAP